MDNMTVGEVRRKRTTYLASSTLSLLFLGLIYAFSMFAAPMSQTFGLEKNAVALTFNIMMISFCCGCVAGSQIEKFLGTKGAIILSAALFFAGFAGTGMLAEGNIVTVYVLYGVLGGAGVGIGYNSIIATTNIWFPDKVGFSSGVLMMGFGLGSLVLGTLSTKLIPLLGLPTVFECIGGATFIVVTLCALILRRPPDDIATIMAPEKAIASGCDQGEDDPILKSPLFYVYCLWATVVIAIGLATIGNCASDAQLVGIDAQFATLLVGLVSTFNGLARVVMGMLYDRTNVKITMLVDGIVAVCATGFIVLAFTASMPVLYICGALCCGFCYGSVPVVASAFTRQRFGQKRYAFNFSVANFAIVFGSLLNIAAQAAVGGADNRIAMFALMGALSVLALADIAWFARVWNRDMKRLSSST